MRQVSIKQDIEQVILQYVKSIPDIFLEFEEVELVEIEPFFWEIIHVESEEIETVLGEVTLNHDLSINVDIFE